MAISVGAARAASLAGSKRADGAVQEVLEDDQADRLGSIAAEVARLSRGLDEANRRTRWLEAEIEDIRWQLNALRGRSFRTRFLPRLFRLRQYPAHELWSPLPPQLAEQPDPSALPVIAIVTPVFNQARWIERTIASVLEQDYPRLNYVVQDAGSRDGTAEIIERYRGALAAYESAPDGGQTQAINRGFAKVSGEIMAWLNGDDFLLPGVLAYVARFFQDNPKVDLIYGHRLIVDEDGGQIGHWILPRHDSEALKWADYVPQETMFWRRRVWDEVGPLDESFRFAMDWDFLLRVQAKGLTLRRVPRFLGCFRAHDAQKTATQGDIYEAEAARLRLRSFGRPVNTSQINRALRSYLRRHVMLERAFKLKIVRY
jgi:GT2 family glycosyltransferase